MKATFCVLVVTLVVVGHVSGYSSSMSCYYKNGQKVCQQQSDPSGNSASSGAVTNGNDGQVFGNAGQYPNAEQNPNAGQYPYAEQNPNAGQYPYAGQYPNAGQYSNAGQYPNSGQYPMYPFFNWGRYYR